MARPRRNNVTWYLSIERKRDPSRSQWPNLSEDPDYVWSFDLKKWIDISIFYINYEVPYFNFTSSLQCHNLKRAMSIARKSYNLIKNDYEVILTKQFRKKTKWKSIRFICNKD